jgi:ketosteroid isomerase-like protein
MTKDDIATITRRERERGEALKSGDAGALSALLPDDLIHIHANGRIETKAQYLESVSQQLEFLKVERPGYDVKVFGDFALAVGTLHQAVRVKATGAVVEMRAATLQSWTRREQQWLQLSFQATRLD